MEESGHDRSTYVRAAIGTVGLILLVGARFLAGAEGAGGRAVASDLLSLLLGIVLVLMPEGVAERPNPGPPPGSTWGTWFTDREREKSIHWSTLSGIVLILASIAGLVLTLFDPLG